jgi:hypothetical protein
VTKAWEGQGITNKETAIADSCYATGKVDGTRYVGGWRRGGEGSVFRCYATGEVTGVTFRRPGRQQVGPGSVLASVWDRRAAASRRVPAGWQDHGRDALHRYVLAAAGISPRVTICEASIIRFWCGRSRPGTWRARMGSR